MFCDPERVTAYVDRELRPPLERALERHLACCSTCAAQAVFEIELAGSLYELHEWHQPQPRAGFSASVLHAVLAEPRLAGH